MRSRLLFPSVRRPIQAGFNRLRWPIPALAVWGLTWAVAAFVREVVQLSSTIAAISGTVMGIALAFAAPTFWRRVIVAFGFPMSLLATGAANTLPAWSWLLPLGLLMLVYPLGTWSDAPLFPSPRNALRGLEQQIALPPRPRVLDAGCGLGHGLQALRAVWPNASFTGIEWSWPVRLLACLSCPWAQILRGDMWRVSWASYDVVYLFQRPESMTRALAKAEAEMTAGAWLVSLEFEVPERSAHGVLRGPGGRPVWLYQVGRPAAKVTPATPVGEGVI